jgi:hypothetical protein
VNVDVCVLFAVTYAKVFPSLTRTGTAIFLGEDELDRVLEGKDDPPVVPLVLLLLAEEDVPLL